MHSGMSGGPAPDPLVGLIQLLATLDDAQGNTTIDELDNTQTWRGPSTPPPVPRDANVLDGAELMGDGRVSDLLGRGRPPR